MIEQNQSCIHDVFSPTDIQNSLMRITEIRFDCIVKMFDKNISEKIPQHFVNINHFTLEMIKYSDPYVLGLELKKMLTQLENHIENHKR